MKKFLFGTSALVGAALVAGGANAMPMQSFGEGGEPILKASIVGQFEAGITDFNQATPGLRHGSFLTGRFSEIWFEGEMTADNGLTYGAVIHLNADSAATTRDFFGFPGRQYVYFSGGWGSLELGSWIGPATSLGVYQNQFATGNGGVDHAWTNYAGIFEGVTAPANVAGAFPYPALFFNNASRINYYSPTVAGFQVGIGYAPAVGVAGLSGGPVGFGHTQAQALTGMQDLIELGGQWSGDFGPAGVVLAATYYNANNNVSGFNDVSAFVGSGAISFAGFRVGGHYSTQGNNHATYTTAAGADSHAWAIMGEYTFGPFGVGLEYAEQRARGNFRGLGQETDRFEAWALQGGYSLAPGVKLYSDIVFWDFKSNTPAAGATADGTTFLGGVYVSF